MTIQITQYGIQYTIHPQHCSIVWYVAYPVYRFLRHLAYRRLAQWLWKRLGKKNRKVLPACAVTKIRETYTSDTHVGYTDALY